MTPTQHPALAEQLATAAKRIEDARITQRTLRANAAKVNKIVQTIYAISEANDARTTISARTRSEYDWKTQETTITGVDLIVYIYVDVTTLKTGPVFNLLEALDAEGFEATSTADCATKYSTRRDYNLRRTDLTVTTRIELTAFIKEDESATCRKEQIGTKWEEVPQYRLVCD